MGERDIGMSEEARHWAKERVLRETSCLAITSFTSRESPFSKLSLRALHSCSLSPYEASMEAIISSLWFRNKV